MNDDLPAIGVLISGRGSNLQALIDAVQEQRLAARIAIVISNRPGVVGLDRARAAGIETVVMEHRGYPSRDVYDRALADAQRQALEHGVKFSGATVHLVTSELDGGPIVMQSVVPVRDDDTVDTLSARILIEEHRIYPDAVRSVLQGGWKLEGRR